MKRRKGLKLMMVMALITAPSLVITVYLTQTPAHAAVDCSSATASTDTDGDGFSDLDECNGITLAGTSGGRYPGFVNHPSGRNQYLDPNSKDLFVILVAASGTTSHLPTDPFYFIYSPKAAPSYGLEIATHQITINQAKTDRTVSLQSTQKAVQVTESLNKPVDSQGNKILGSSASMHGTPNDKDTATIYTLNIEDHANIDIYGGTAPSDFVLNYKRHTIAHEIAHSLMLTTKYDRKIGYHYASGTGVILDQQVYYSTSGGGDPIPNLGITFKSGDQSGAALK